MAAQEGWPVWKDGRCRKLAGAEGVSEALTAMSSEMTADEVIRIVRLLRDSGIRVHVDGGWGVDALLGKQTRPHADLDIAVPHSDVPKLRKLLAQQGYRESPRDDAWECNFVLVDEFDHEVDVHSYTFDEQGKSVFGVPYPAESLTGVGVIDDCEVACISPAWMVAFHTGYEPDQNDYLDVSALCERFGIELPPEYRRFLGHSITNGGPSKGGT